MNGATQQKLNASGILVKLELNLRAAELAARNDTFTQIARTAARFFSAGRGAVTLRLPNQVAYIGRHGIPFSSLPKEYDLGVHVDNPKIFKDLRKSRNKALRRLSQLQGGIAFFAYAPIYDFHMNPIGLVSVGDASPMDHPAAKLATLQDLAGIAFGHLVLLLQTLNHPMHADDPGLQSSIDPVSSSAPAVDLFQTTGLAHSPSSFDDNKSPKFNGNPVSNFLSRTLISKRQVSHRKNVTYFTVKTWKKPIKDAQISAMRALKVFGSEELTIQAAGDIVSTLKGLLGTLDFDFVTAIPCMHSKGDSCLSVSIGQKISSSTGIPFKQCFKREYRAGSSHPVNNAKLPPFKLTEQVSGKILLVDDVATSGAHMEKAANRLRENGASVFCVAWIGSA